MRTVGLGSPRASYAIRLMAAFSFCGSAFGGGFRVSLILGEFQRLTHMGWGRDMGLKDGRFPEAFLLSSGPTRLLTTLHAFPSPGTFFKCPSRPRKVQRAGAL